MRMGHGADPFLVQLSRKTLDTIRINAVHLAQQKSCRTAVGQARPWRKSTPFPCG